MKAKYNFEIMELDDEMVAVPIGGADVPFNGVLKVNDTAATILKILEEDRTEEEIVEILLEQYTDENNQIRGYVHEFVEKLNTEGILE